jgi:hypothetical protein
MERMSWIRALCLVACCGCNGLLLSDVRQRAPGHFTKGERATLWEIHPILHFEVWQGGGVWKTVDDVL